MFLNACRRIYLFWYRFRYFSAKVKYSSGLESVVEVALSLLGCSNLWSVRSSNVRLVCWWIRFSNAVTWSGGKRVGSHTSAIDRFWWIDERDWTLGNNSDGITSPSQSVANVRGVATDCPFGSFDADGFCFRPGSGGTTFSSWCANWFRRFAECRWWWSFLRRFRLRRRSHTNWFRWFGWFETLDDE